MSVAKTKGYVNRLILFPETPKRLLIDYIKDSEDLIPAAFIYKSYNRRLKNSDWYDPGERTFASILGLRHIPKENWRKLIQEFLLLEEREWKKLGVIDGSTIVPTPEWLKKRKESYRKGNITVVDKVSINPKWLERGTRGTIARNGSPCTLIAAKKINSLVIYGSEDDREKLEAIFHLFPSFRRIKMCLLVKRDLQRVSDANLQNWITYDKFMEGTTKPFARIATAILACRMEEKFYTIFSRRNSIKDFSVSLFEKMEAVDKYVKNNYYVARANQSFENAILEIAQEHNYWDGNVLTDIKYLEEVLPKFDFLELLQYHSPGLTPAQVKLARDVLKYRKFKMDLHNYDIPLKKEEALEVEEDVDLEDEVEFEIEDEN